MRYKVILRNCGSLLNCGPISYKIVCGTRTVFLMHHLLTYSTLATSIYNYHRLKNYLTLHTPTSHMGKLIRFGTRRGTSATVWETLIYGTHIAILCEKVSVLRYPNFRNRGLGYTYLLSYVGMSVPIFYIIILNQLSTNNHWGSRA